LGVINKEDANPVVRPATFKIKIPADNLHLINQVRTWPVPMPIHL
jgi:hypothetical protein